MNISSKYEKGSPRWIFDYMGENHIAPKLTLTGEIGNDLTSTTVGADVTALFDLYYYTDPTKEDIQKLKINGGIFVQVLTFKKRWDLGTAEINLSGNSSSSKEMVRSLKLKSGSRELFSAVILKSDNILRYFILPDWI